MDDDPYCWPGTECLRNLLDIRDAKELDKAEHELAGVRNAALTASTLPGAYDLAHLRRFHRFLFQDVYDWAGELRTVDIYKGEVGFCRAQDVDHRLEQLFGKLATRRLLVTLEWDSYVIAFATVYGELNAIHPFREGNGRTQRAFLRQFAAHAGWTVAWESLTRRDNDAACHRYLTTGKPHALIKLLAPAIAPRM
ncbi:Fic family protein [Frankia sp. CNm7]|uniref:protein adenylyltransferase n=1 Tax=Frankia nepalensis TaxID=1836974 RepID=A0A937UM74_9ACTN|nr:Fic family protein [Frankia nepalensis]MBL7497091.1 Fic family protein [Frankia nepalensis]MBL7510763.1 Fic family protein [Frankia nepalensis]MBL7522481.1 Fic family protein [Frankia nepalensis]MBL7626773.1 Fic family protein [Frankia nepalensis]